MVGPLTVTTCGLGTPSVLRLAMTTVSERVCVYKGDLLRKYRVRGDESRNEVERA